jgi:aspartyl-tRNA(Asn)/glutamyl-tRNA(Gln) amidotransferase subunit A
LSDARLATQEISAGRYRCPLHGIPLGLKDSIDTEGIRTTGGAMFYSNRVPMADSTVASRLRRAGSILLGKLNMHELALGSTGENVHFGQTRNPWNHSCISGGSSGGAAAATSAHLVMGAIGTDTAGSIRVPASLCGVVGLKPTHGLVSNSGVLPLAWSYDVVGPIARTVEDAALLMQVIAGYDARDPRSVRRGIDDFTDGMTLPIDSIKIAVPTPYFFEQIDDEVSAATEEALRVLRNLGAIVHEVNIPNVENAVHARRTIVIAEARQIYGELMRDHPNDFGQEVLSKLREPRPSIGEFLDAVRTVDAVASAIRQTLEDFDVLVTPTTPVTAPRMGQESAKLGGIQTSIARALVRCTAPFSMSQLPALSVPCGFTAAGLPIGLQIVGRPFDERLTLRVGYNYEQATGSPRRRPPLAALSQ